MILKGNQRGGGGQLARHLTNTADNDHVELYEIRDLGASDVAGAFQEIEAHAAGTKCKQPFFSVSLSPPQDCAATIEQYEQAIDAIEAKFPALAKQPRVILFHEKEGRRHCHVVWSRIDTERMKAIPLPFTRERLREASREMFHALGREPPPGLQDRAQADKRNYGPAIWQQAKRLSEDPRDLKQIIGDAWARSDNRPSFERALQEHGLMLAQGDRRGFVIIHHSGEVLSLSRYAGIRTIDTAAKIGPAATLRTVEQARAILTARMGEGGGADRLDSLKARQAHQMRPLRERAAAMKQTHRAERDVLRAGHETRRQQEGKARADRLRKGVVGIWDRVTGRRGTIMEANHREARAGHGRDRGERQGLIDRQHRERGKLQASIVQMRRHHQTERKEALRGGPQRQQFRPTSESFQKASSTARPEAPPRPARTARPERTRQPDGTRLTDDPKKIIEALTTQHSTFTRAELARFVEKHTTGPDAKAAMDRVMAFPELAKLGKDQQGRDRFTARDLAGIEQKMVRDAEALKDRTAHPVSARTQEKALRSASVTLSAEQQAAFRHVTEANGCAAIVGFAGSGKSTMLGAARQAWEESGYRVQGAALSGIAADGLQAGAGIDSRTLHSRLYDWDKGRDLLTAKDVLVIDEAGMVGSRLMGRVLDHARQAGAKVVLVGDPEQLQAIDAGAAFRAITEKTGSAEISTIRRQREDWQQDATREFATGGTAKALHRYEDAGAVHQHEGQDDARSAVIAGWDQARKENPDAPQIILAYTRVDVRDLNGRARSIRREVGELGPDHAMQTEAGPRQFATADRLYFLKNDRTMGVRNGSLGTIEAIEGDRLTVKLDGDGRRVTFDTKIYSQIDHGYAATIHKSQGVTVDRAHVLASKYMDRHAAYVGMTRHRDRVDVHWSKEEFGNRAGLSRRLGRQRAKDTSLDYGAAGPPHDPPQKTKGAKSARSERRQPRQPRPPRPGADQGQTAAAKAPAEGAAEAQKRPVEAAKDFRAADSQKAADAAQGQDLRQDGPDLPKGDDPASWTKEERAAKVAEQVAALTAQEQAKANDPTRDRARGRSR